MTLAYAIHAQYVCYGLTIDTVQTTYYNRKNTHLTTLVCSVQKPFGCVCCFYY